MRVEARNLAGPLPRGADGAWQTCEGDEIIIEVESDHPAAGWLSGSSLAPRAVVRRGAKILTAWLVPIHTWAGRAELEVNDGASRSTFYLDVLPHPGKLGIDAFREMLDEIAAIHPNLPWGLSPGALTAERVADSPPIVHPAVLEHELPLLLNAIAQLRRDPLLWSRPAREVRALRHARQLDQRSLRWLVTHPRPLLAMVAPAASPREYDSVLIEQRRTRTSFDHPATAHIRFLLERLGRTLARSADELALLAKRVDAEDSEHAIWLSRRVRRATDAITSALELEPLSLVEPRPATEGAVQAVVDHPVYARVQRIAQRLLNPGLAVSQDTVLRASLRRTHELYELLVLYRMVDAARRALGRAWTWDSENHLRTGALDALASNAAFVARGPEQGRLEIRYQATFSAYRAVANQGERYTLSGERRPDMIAGLFLGNNLVRWIQVDAKYRASRAAVHDALADLHVYRDALRWHGKQAAGSFIAVPACRRDAEVYASRSYLKEHAFGALVTSDRSCWLAPLGLLLDERSFSAGDLGQEQAP